jgi:GNAT superfamily N-acetyltransferase
MNMSIRLARPDDAPVLVEFNHRLAAETEGIALHLPTLEDGVRAVFADPAKGQYFVAETDARVLVGQLMITHEWSDWRNGDIWWIQSVYVHPDHRRRGVFRALYRHVEAAARAAGVVLIRLYVHDDNRTGQGTYASLGMTLTHYKVMEAWTGAAREGYSGAGD